MPKDQPALPYWVGLRMRGEVSQKTAILIVGMHRSGTSALAKTIALSGARLPNDLVEPNEGNPTGHWEPKSFVNLNDRMLADAGSDVYSTGEINPGWFSSPRIEQFKEEAASVLRTSYENDPLIVVKDPRLALLLPIWHAAFAELGYHCIHVLPLRRPSDVAKSLRRRHLKTLPYDAWPSPRGETVWLRYTLASVLKTRGFARCFVNYADLLQDWRRVIKAVADETGVQWPRLGTAHEREIDQFLHQNAPAGDATKYRTEQTGDLAHQSLANLANTLFGSLCTRGDDGTRVDAIAAEFFRRMSGTSDLVAVLEGLYPLVWKYHETSQKATASGELNEISLRATIHQLWSNLMRATADNGSMQQDLASCQERVRGLELALDQLQATFGECGGQRDEFERQLSEHVRILNENAHQLNECKDEILALRSSTSWRITAPLRAIIERLRA